MAEKETNAHIQAFLDLFDDKIESGTLQDEDRITLVKLIPSSKELADSLPTLLQKNNDFKANIENCDRNIKNWQESKKMWTSRSKGFLEVLQQALDSLGIPKGVQANGVKLSTSSRTSYEIDEQWMLDQYQAMADALQSQLPDYIKVSISIDKIKLAAFLKSDSTLLINYPEKVHTKISTSTTIK